MPYLLQKEVQQTGIILKYANSARLKLFNRENDVAYQSKTHLDTKKGLTKINKVTI